MSAEVQSDRKMQLERLRASLHRLLTEFSTFEHEISTTGRRDSCTASRADHQDPPIARGYSRSAHASQSLCLSLLTRSSAPAQVRSYGGGSVRETAPSQIPG